MTVINVYDYHKNFVGCFANAKIMINYLIDHKYINKNFEVPHNHEWLPLDEAFGEDWADIIAEWDVGNFAELVPDYLFMEEVEVID